MKPEPGVGGKRRQHPSPSLALPRLLSCPGHGTLHPQPRTHGLSPFYIGSPNGCISWIGVHGSIRSTCLGFTPRTHIHTASWTRTSITPIPLALSQEYPSTGFSLGYPPYQFCLTHSVFNTELRYPFSVRLCELSCVSLSVCQRCLVWLVLLGFHRAVVGARKGVGVVAMSQGLHLRPNISSLSI